LRWRRRSAANRSSPTSSAARPQARELAVSHTGALAGEDDVADVFLKACGIARVDTLDA
jgi:acyl-CoA synthetase (NDP forming)